MSASNPSHPRVRVRRGSDLTVESVRLDVYAVDRKGRYRRPTLNAVFDPETRLIVGSWVDADEAVMDDVDHYDLPWDWLNPPPVRRSIH